MQSGIAAKPIPGSDTFRGSFSGYERDVFFYNPPGTGRLVELGYGLDLDFPDDGRAFIPLDVDGDGDLDLPMASLQGLRLLENTLPREGRHFTRVKLEATKTQHHALGARVVVESGGVAQQDFVTAVSGFQTQVPLELHFGLGAATRVDRLTIEWPSGAKETFEGLPADVVLRFTEGKGHTEKPLVAWPEETRPRAPRRYALEARANKVGGGEGPLAPAGKPVLVNFWAPWCQPCAKELPALAALARAHQGKVDFAGVSVEVKDTAAVEKAIQQHGLAYPQLYANPAVLESFFGGEGNAPLPSTFVFDKKGAIRRVFHRAVEAKELEDLLASLISEPDYLPYLQQLGDLALGKGELVEARRIFERALAVDPNAVFALAQLGTIATLEKKQPEAIQHLEKATKLDPDFPYAWHRLGWAYRTSGDRAKAVKAFQRAVELKPDDAGYLGSLAVAHSEAGKLEDAAATFEQLLGIDPANPQVWLNLAKIRANLGQRDPALAAARRVVSIDPSNAEARNILRDLSRN